MTTPPTNELEMQAHTVETPASLDELLDYINKLVTQNHDYGTGIYAMSMAATAAFNYVASTLGASVFQAGLADLDILRRTRRMKGPFIILKAEDMCYPQYSLQAELAEAMDSWKPWVAKECAKKLAEVDAPHPDVKAHWEKLSQPQ